VYIGWNMGVEEHKPCHHIQAKVRQVFLTENTETLNIDAEKARLKTKQAWTAHYDGSRLNERDKKKQKLIHSKERTG